MSSIQLIPHNQRELSENFQKLKENKAHVKSVDVNLTNGHLEVLLDWAAHNLGHTQDFFIPIKRNHIRDAKELVTKILAETNGGAAVSDAEISQLFDYVDQSP